jgi:hypothetical protein
MGTFSHVYDLGASVEEWERSIRRRIESAVGNNAVIESVSVDETTGLASATLDDATASDIKRIDNELVIETIEQSARYGDRTYVSFGSIVPSA